MLPNPLIITVATVTSHTQTNTKSIFEKTLQGLTSNNLCTQHVPNQNSNKEKLVKKSELGLVQEYIQEAFYWKQHLSACMECFSKSLPLLLVVTIAVSSLIMVESASALSVTKPTVPEFKLSYTNHVYDVPAATSEWSGEPIPNSGYHVDYREVYIKVKNQPHDAYINGDVNGAKEQLFYNIRVKNHFSNEWTELYGRTSIYNNGNITTGTYYQGASDTDVTSIPISLNGPTNIIHASKDVALGNQVDFQVKALIGYQDWVNQSFFGEESIWSDTQTLTIDTSNSTPTPSNPPLTPNQSAIPSSSADSTVNLTSVPLSLLVAVVAVFLVIIISLVIFYRRPPKTRQ
jgi:hypothetical protein